MRIPIILGLALLGALSTAIAADDPPSVRGLPIDEVMKNLDRNQNGCIEEEEGRNYVSRRFHFLDANQDGQLDAGEAPPEPGDSNAMRPIDVAAWQDAYHARFSQLDGDGNGCLSGDEVSAGRASGNASKGEG